MSSTLKLKVSPVTAIDDEGIIRQLPKKVRKDLGQDIGSGFNLMTSKRDLEFENGLVQYVLGNDSIEVIMD